MEWGTIRNAGCALACYGLVSSLPGTAFAAPEASPTADGSGSSPELPLDWQATSDCSDAATFRDMVAERAPHSRAPAGRRFVVELLREEGGARGRLTVIEPSSEPGERSVVGRDCHDAAEALALITALLLEPIPEAPPAATPAQAPAEPPAPVPKARSEWRLFVGGLALTGSAPRPLFSGMAGLDWRLAGPSIFSPRLRLSGLWTEERAFPAGAFLASFQQAGGVFEACPLDVSGPSQQLSLHLCGALELAALQAAGFGTDSVEAHSVPFGSAGPALLFGMPLGGAFRLDLRGAVVFPFWHDRFVLDGSLVHEVPLAAARVGAELSVDLGL